MDTINNVEVLIIGGGCTNIMPFFGGFRAQKGLSRIRPLRVHTAGGRKRRQHELVAVEKDGARRRGALR